MAITISYSGSTVTIPDRLVKSPFGFNEVNTRRGRTAEMISIDGLLLRSEAAALVALFKSYRDVKITEEDPQKTGVTGATVAITGSGVGFSWNNRACWVDKAPSVEYRGAFVKVTADFVDATQALQILLEERDDSDEDGINLGTITLGSAVINLLSYPLTYEELPQPSRNPAGVHVFTGQLTLQEAKEVEGWVTEVNKNNLESWLTTVTATTPAPNTWYPVSYQRPVAKTRFGALTYDVGLKIIKIR
jgi:hypothetical protein